MKIVPEPICIDLNFSERSEELGVQLSLTWAIWIRIDDDIYEYFCDSPRSLGVGIPPFGIEREH